MEIRTMAAQEDYVELGRTLTQRKSKLFRRRPPIGLFIAILAVSFLLFLVFRLRPAPLPGAPFILRRLIMILLVAEMILAGFYLLLYWAVGRQYKSMYNNAQQRGVLGAIVTLNEAGVRTRAENGSQDLFFAWNTISKLLVSQNLCIFVTSGNIAVFFGRRFIPPEQQPLFEAWLRYGEGFGMKTEWRV